MMNCWVGVPADWAKSTFMSLCLDVAAPTQRHHVLVDLVEVARPDVCQWSDSCPHDVDLTNSENDDDRDDDIDIH